MNTLKDLNGFEIDFYFARLVVALELRRTHGVYFAACFLEEFDIEIRRAVATFSERLLRR